MATAQTTHHVTIELNGTTYGLMVKNFHERDMTAFAPKIASGNMKWSDGTIYQTLAQEDWSHGFGYREMIDPSGYSHSDDGIDTRFGHKVTIMTKLVDASTVDTGLTCYPVVKFIEFGGSVYALMNDGTNGGVLRWDDTDGKWVASLAQTGNRCRDGITDGNYLYVTLEGARMKRTADGVNWSDCLQSSAYDMEFICSSGRYIWVSDGSLPFVHYGELENGKASDPLMWEGGDPENGGDPNATYVGAGNVPITGLVSWKDALYIGRQDGLWYVPDEVVAQYVVDGEGNPPAYKALNFENEAHSYNFRTMAVWNSALYYTIKNELWRQTGLTVTNVSPPEWGYNYPYSKYGNFRFLTPIGPFLYVVADEDDGISLNGYGEMPYGEGPYGGSLLKSVLLCYNGEGAWHRLLEICDYTSTVAGMNYSPENNKLWISVSGTPNKIYYIPFRSGSYLPYAKYESTDSPPDNNDNPHYLYTSLFTAELATIVKHFTALTIQGQFGSVSPIDVYYSLDNGAWKHLGTYDSDDSDSETIEFPSTLADCVGKQIAFRINLQTSNENTTPVLQRMILQYLPRPSTIYTYSFDIYIADNIATLNRDLDGNTAYQLYYALKTARAQQTPFTFYDIWNQQHKVYCTAIDWRKTRFESGNANSPMEVEGVIGVTLVVATNEGL